MSTQHASLIGEELRLGDHIAFFFKEETERSAFVIPYMIRGLQNHERCLYVAHENTVAEILDEFKSEGFDAATAVASGALKVLTVKETYLRHGVFEPMRMIADLDSDVRTALTEGHTGLRMTGEMSWALDLPSALARLCDYEEELRRRWPAKLGGLCQYNESLFPSDVVDRIVEHHHVVVRDGQVIRHRPHRQD